MNTTHALDSKLAILADTAKHDASCANSGPCFTKWCARRWTLNPRSEDSKISKSQTGIAGRFPRLSRRRKEKKPGQADTVETLHH
jgi:hypothetical protein